MRRTKAWWARLTKAERSELYWLEKADREPTGCSAYLPDGYGDCGMCSSPAPGGGLCTLCWNRLTQLLNKADGKEANDG